jgi:N-acetylglucosaminyldiphosphoundecaprenol N-acetyl-beta-D-mannosaminyltransferase
MSQPRSISGRKHVVRCVVPGSCIEAPGRMYARRFYLSMRRAAPETIFAIADRPEPGPLLKGAAHIAAGSPAAMHRERNLTGSGEIANLRDVAKVRVGGARVARLDLEQTARLMIALARAPGRGAGPCYMTSVNGEVLALRHRDPAFARLVDAADVISADGQPLVLISKLFHGAALPERVATTDLYPIVAREAERTGASFYLLGAREEPCRAAYEATRRAFPRLDIRGYSHGYLAGEALMRKLDEINALAPDILWLAMGVPIEQRFACAHATRLANVKVIKTSGGLFDFISGTKPRAPAWMQAAGIEWAYRVAREPRRLFRRYVTTNPVALMLLVTRTGGAGLPKSPAPE